MVEVATHPAVSDALPRQRVLLVHDDQALEDSVRRLLEPSGWEIETSRESRHALALVGELSPDVLVTDFGLVGLRGAEFLSQASARSPLSQRIVLAGEGEQEALAEAVRREQCFRLIQQPWNSVQLSVALRSAVEAFSLRKENDRLKAVALRQEDEFRRLNADLESRVQVRTTLLAVAKMEWETTFDSIDLPIAVVSRDYSVKRANVAYSRVGEKPIRDLGARPKCHQYLFARAEPCEGCALSQSLETGQDGRAEISDRGRTYVQSVYPMSAEDQAVCSYRDITEDRLLTRRMVHNEKMAAVGQLAGGVAHEINNPLGGILAFTQLMQRDSDRNEADLESLGLIEESALRCKRIVESLVRFSRRGSLHAVREMDLSRCVEDAVLLFGAQLKAAPRARLELKLDPSLPDVHGEPAQLGQVVLSLLQNALYALPDKGGVLSVETGEQDDRCFVRVTDTGTGIIPENLPRLFEPHFTTKPPGEGAGLGLAIAYRVVEDHGGTFQVESQAGLGSTFTLFLPIPTSPVAAKGNP